MFYTRWLLVPLAGAVLYIRYAPSPPSVKTILTASHIIPCTALAGPDGLAGPSSINSPNEDRVFSLPYILRWLKLKIWEPLLTGVRFCHLVLIFLPVIVAAPMLLVGVPEKKLDGDRWGAVWWYGLLTAQMQRAGPTFIKMSQWAASRKDLFPSLLCEKLGRLHSNGKPHSFAHTRRVIERVFGMSFDQVFESFDRTPIGCGAIAQVYKGKLKHSVLPPSYLNPRHASDRKFAPQLARPPPASPPSAEVAIKILHPRVEKTISRDLSIMSFFARALSLIPSVQWLSLPDEVEVFGQMMRSQLDLREEAANLRRFEKNFENRQFAVGFPRPVEEYTTNDVLVEEYENALPLPAFLKYGGGPFDEQLANMGLDAFLNMLLLDNFVHTDLHPGNIMVKFYKPSTGFFFKHLGNKLFGTPKPNEEALFTESDAIVDRLKPLAKVDAPSGRWLSELENLHEEGYLPELIFVDTGLVTTLSPTNRRNFLDLFQAVAEFDGYRAGQLMIERCRTPELAIDTETFALKMQHLILSVKSKTFSLAQIRISDILSEVLTAVRTHHVRMEADFVNTVISILLLEGIGRQLDPNMDLFRSALPILRQVGRKMGSSPGQIKEYDMGSITAIAKVWVWMEARELANAAFSSIDEIMRYDWLTPNI
ncbi:ABC1-domain-containing protein [Calocera viscosa TUFC12733]|uniref:ABC1-domain-containing protein n=1 Tax=Calocera viscosa (strain TUFC12733) TaxID=1330018 RepID=A0A167LS49_CALVF|nr:ABC1-domain-containing protein [Calocera viscosa TUFC12733]